MLTIRARALAAALSIASAATFGDRLGRAGDIPASKRSGLYSDLGHQMVQHSADKMASQLAKTPELNLLRGADGKKLFEKSEDLHPVLAEIDRRNDLSGLPVIRGDACQLTAIQAQHLNDTSRLFRQLFAKVSGEFDRRFVDWKHIDSVLNENAVGSDAALILQMLQCEHTQFRSLLNHRLALSAGPSATKALAHRSVFELDPNRREEAVRLLKAQVSPTARQFLLDGLRYPYAPMADHAAAALIALQDRDSVPALVAMLDAPDPVSPMPNEDGNPMVAEVVRINHARNCQLCHAPSWDAKDPVRVAVPSTAAPLPPPFSFAYYSDSGQGEMVRADVTYLRQDFSLTLPVQDPGPWPKLQRFDFLVRQRPALPWELQKRWSNIDYPQRYAVLRALRKITNRDYGIDADAWRDGLRKEGRFKI